MSQKRDPAWAYETPMGSNTKVKCSFCDVTYNSGIFHHKRHLIGGYRDVKVCLEVPDKVKEEIKEYMLKKNEFKTQMNHEASMVNLVDNDGMDDDEFEVNICQWQWGLPQSIKGCLPVVGVGLPSIALSRVSYESLFLAKIK